MQQYRKFLALELDIEIIARHGKLYLREKPGSKKPNFDIKHRIESHT